MTTPRAVLDAGRSASPWLNHTPDEELDRVFKVMLRALAEEIPVRFGFSVDMKPLESVSGQAIARAALLALAGDDNVSESSRWRSPEDLA